MEYDKFKIVGTAAFIICGITYWERSRIYNWVKNKMSLLIIDTLEDKKVNKSLKKSAESLVNGIISDDEYIEKGNVFMCKFVEKISTDPHYVNKLTVFANNVLQNESLRESLLNFLLGLLNNDEMMNIFFIRAIQLLDNVTSNEVLKKKVIKYLQDILEDENNQIALVGLLSKTLSNPELHDTAATFIKETMNRDDVQESINKTLTTAAVKNFNDEEVKTASKAMIVDALKSEEVRKEASDALYDVLKKLTVPKWFKN